MNDKDFLIKPSYDADADALFIKRTDDYEYAESVELDNNIVLDFDTKGVPSALEILNASTVFDITKFALKNIKNISMQIEVLEDLIHVRFVMGVLFRNEEIPKIIDEITLNDINAPINNVELVSA